MGVEARLLSNWLPFIFEICSFLSHVWVQLVWRKCRGVSCGNIRCRGAGVSSRNCVRLLRARLAGWVGCEDWHGPGLPSVQCRLLCRQHPTRQEMFLCLS